MAVAEMVVWLFLLLQACGIDGRLNTAKGAKRRAAARRRAALDKVAVSTAGSCTGKLLEEFGVKVRRLQAMGVALRKMSVRRQRVHDKHGSSPFTPQKSHGPSFPPHASRQYSPTWITGGGGWEGGGSAIAGMQQ